MWILIAYVLIVVVGEAVVIAIGLILDAGFVGVILRCARVWMTAGRALDRA